MSKYADDFSDRHKYLGASECAAALGHSEWTPRYDLWREKTRRLARGHKRIFDRGHEMEPVMVKMLKDDFGVDVIKQQQEYVNPDLPWLVSHVDGIIPEYFPLPDGLDIEAEGEGVLEMKAPGSNRVRKLISEGLDDDYIVQMQVNLMNAGLTWGRFAFLDYDKYELVCFDVKADKALAKHVFSGVQVFWKAVESDTYDEAFEPVDLDRPDVGDTIVNLDGGGLFDELLISCVEKKSLADETKAEYESMRNDIKTLLEKRGFKGAHKPGVGKALLVAKKGSERIDGKALNEWTTMLCGHLLAGRTSDANVMSNVFMKDRLFVKQTAGSVSVRVTTEDYNG